MQPHVPTSVVLAKLIDDAPKDFVNLDWLLGHLQKRSLGLLLLILAIVHVGDTLAAMYRVREAEGL